MAIRVVGFATAVIGTCAAVPAATWRLMDGTKSSVRSTVGRLLRRPPSRSVVVAAGVDLKVQVGTATVTAIHVTGGSVDERLVRLETAVQGLENQRAQIVSDIQREVTERTQAHDELRSIVWAESARLDQVLADQQRASEEVDARALPVILVGAALSTFPDVLAIDALAGTGFLVVGLCLFFRDWYLIDLHSAARPAAQRGHAPRGRAQPGP